MPIPSYIIKADGSLDQFSQAQVTALGIEQTRGIRDGSSPRRQGNQTQETLAHKCFVAAGKVDDTISYLMGATKSYTSTIDGRLHLSRLLPQAYPGFSWLRGVELTSNTGFKFKANVKGAKQWSKATYDREETEWLFQTLPFNLATDNEVSVAGDDEGIRYVQELPTQQFSEYLTYPSLGLKYTTVSGVGRPQGIPVGFNNGFPLLHSIISRKWYRIPFECYTAGTTLYRRLFGRSEPRQNTTDMPYVGTINKYTFLGYPPGTLLLLCPESEVVYDQASSAYCFNITYKFKYNPFGHNKLLFFDFIALATGFYFVANDGVYRTTAATPDGVSIFNVRDFGVTDGYGGIFAVG